MARLGISIYPEHSELQSDLDYISLASKYGFKRIFSCLLSGEQTKEEIVVQYKSIVEHAHNCGMEIILDVAPFVFDKLGVTYDNLSFFKNIGVDGIRLDEGFGGAKEAMMSCNKENLKIEINASFGNKYIANIMSHYPSADGIITCHNFYPQRYTGLSLEHFNRCNEDIKSHNLKIAAFVSSNVEGSYGPWPVNEGLCTLEMHRNLPIDVQARHLFATRMVDDVLIANCYASESEFKKLSSIQPGVLTFGIDFEVEPTENDKKVIFDHEHFVRGDMSAYMARSTMPRVTYENESFPPNNTRDLKRGDIVIINDDYSRYKGELHIVLQDMPNDGRKNVIGSIPNYESILLDYIEPWRPFAFTTTD